LRFFLVKFSADLGNLERQADRNVDGAPAGDALLMMATVHNLVAHGR
jgi:hypothetical protein